MPDLDHDSVDSECLESCVSASPNSAPFDLTTTTGDEGEIELELSIGQKGKREGSIVCHSPIKRLSTG